MIDGATCKVGCSTSVGVEMPAFPLVFLDYFADVLVMANLDTFVLFHLQLTSCRVFGLSTFGYLTICETGVVWLCCD